MSTVPNFQVPSTEMDDVDLIFGFPMMLSGALLLFTATLLALARLPECSVQPAIVRAG